MKEIYAGETLVFPVVYYGKLLIRGNEDDLERSYCR